MSKARDLSSVAEIATTIIDDSDIGVTVASQDNGALAATALQSSSSLAAANLTGALPAIDGSALTGVGASTTYGAVGTYIWGRPQNNLSYAAGATASGLYSAGFPNNNSQYTGSAWWETFSQQQAVSGTWRAMTNCLGSAQGINGFSCLWVRIS